MTDAQRRLLSDARYSWQVLGAAYQLTRYPGERGVRDSTVRALVNRGEMVAVTRLRWSPSFSRPIPGGRFLFPPGLHWHPQLRTGVRYEDDLRAVGVLA